jgi:hypothetical protein
VYHAEKMISGGMTYHKACFTCSEFTESRWKGFQITAPEFCNLIWTHLFYSKSLFFLKWKQSSILLKASDYHFVDLCGHFLIYGNRL